MQNTQTIPTVHLNTNGLTAMKPQIKRSVPGFPEISIDADMVVRYEVGERAGQVVANRWRPHGEARPHVRLYIDGQEYERDVIAMYERAFGRRTHKLLTDTEVREMRAAYNGGAKVRDIARHFNVFAATVYQVVHGKTYTSVN